jgi:DNA-binding GntR family transcriptional regulator
MPIGVTPKRNKTKRHEVARQLENAILAGRLRPADRLPELKLASELGVSQACIREALQELEALGLVVKHPNRGSFVIDLTGDDLVHIHQVRCELEPLACAMAAVTANQAMLDELERCIEQMRTGGEKRNYQAYLDADYRFHLLIWQSQPNRYLEKALKTICLPLFAGDLVRRSSTAYLNFDRAVKQHRLIVKALRTGDSALVTKVTRRLIERFLKADLADYAQLRRLSALEESP